LFCHLLLLPSLHMLFSQSLCLLYHLNVRSVYGVPAATGDLGRAHLRRLRLYLPVSIAGILLPSMLPCCATVRAACICAILTIGVPAAGALSAAGDAFISTIRHLLSCLAVQLFSAKYAFLYSSPCGGRRALCLSPAVMRDGCGRPPCGARNSPPGSCDGHFCRAFAGVSQKTRARLSVRHACCDERAWWRARAAYQAWRALPAALVWLRGA